MLLWTLLIVGLLGGGLGLARPSQASTGIQIVPLEDVLAQHSERMDGELYFRHPDGSRARFLTNVQDPEIPNSGDGQFHPVSVRDVEDALAGLPPAVLRDLECSIFILPYPRSGLLSSSADGRGIYLSPGVREYSRAQVSFLVAHEVGHVFQRHYFPQSDRQGWSSYRQMRGIEDTTVYRDGAPHAYQPREIFAEDFRVLFGGSLARGSGRVENQELCSPFEVPGLESLFREMAGMPSAAEATADLWGLSPNPSGPRSLLTLAAPSLASSSELVDVAIMDVNGRKILEPRFHAEGERSWILELGAESIGRGVFFLRIRTDDGQVATLPLRRFG